MTLPVTRLTLYKHGLGFFERTGEAESSFSLEMPRRAMDDVLKSLTVIPDRAVVESITFETPTDRNPNAQRQPLQIDATRPLSSVLVAMVGQRVAVTVGDRVVGGELMGLEVESDEHLERALLSVLTNGGIELVPLKSVTNIDVADPAARADVAFALESRRNSTERAQATVTLSSASAVEVSYIAPAPSWRVSYRVLIGAAGEPSNPSDERDVFIQGWGLFDNTLEEDLTDITLSLVAGMPVSFRYELHQPNTPERPVVRDEERTVRAPIEFARMESESVYGAAPAPAMAMAAAPARMRSKATPEMFAESAPVQAAGEARGTLFSYEIAKPVSVRRGESGMVPILTVRTPGRREWLFNAAKQERHPVAAVRLRNGPLTLERGPATVLEDGDYAGEAVVPFSPGGSELLLAFSVEFGIGVTVESAYREERRSLRIIDGSLFIGVLEYTETSYHAASDLAKQSVLTIEHARLYGTELLTTPVEDAPTEARFSLTVPAAAKATLTIIERRESSRYEAVSGLDGHRLAMFLNERLLDQATFDALSSLVEMYGRVQRLSEEDSEREEEREKVRARMDDTRQNLAPLDATHDSALRARFISQLQSLEDRMVALDRDDETALAEATDLEGQINDELRRLAVR